jgi:uncharacterized surface protein with fasciclin (FAS1) repeats
VLVSILTYHVVSGTVLAEDVVAVDVLASNGVIHVIDAVILPPSLDLGAL